jgi:hypothetical protein
VNTETDLELELARRWAERTDGRAVIAKTTTALLGGDRVDPCGAGLVRAAPAGLGRALADADAGWYVPVIFTPRPRPDLDASWGGPRCAICGGRAVPAIYKRNSAEKPSLVHADLEDHRDRPHNVIVMETRQ